MSQSEQERAALIERLREGVDTWFGAHGADETQAAMVETAFLMAFADGRIDPAEYDELVSTLARVTGQTMSIDRIRIIGSQLLELLRQEGWEARVAAVAGSIPSPHSRRSAFMLAAGMAFIDGVVQPEEAQLFTLLADQFAIPRPEAEILMREMHRSLFAGEMELTNPVILLTRPR
jgi:hypothetical protein